MTQIIRQPRIRVAAVILQEDLLLLVRHKKAAETYWMLPGGGVDYGETLTEALQRELQEEMCIEADIGPLLFANDSIAPDHHRHIVNLYFCATIKSGTPRLGQDERVVEVAFHPVTSLHEISLRPDFGETLQGLLQSASPVTVGYLGNIWRD